MTIPKEPNQDAFAAHVKRLVLEGKLTSAEAAELLDPVQVSEASTPNGPASGSAVEPVDLGKPSAESGSSVPPDLRLEIAGYRLRVLWDPSLSEPLLSASKDGALQLRSGPEGWQLVVTHLNWSWQLRAVLSLPFVPRNVKAEVSGGSLTLPDILGEAKVEVSGGSATLGATGQLKAEVSGGNLTAGAVAGSSLLEVNGGNLSIGYATALRAEVNGGHLHWTGLLATGQHVLEVNGGQATLNLEAGSSLSVHAEANLGSVSANFALQKSGGLLSATYAGVLGSAVGGAVGGAVASLKCELNAGQIRLVDLTKSGMHRQDAP